MNDLRDHVSGDLRDDQRRAPRPPAGASSAPAASSPSARPYEHATRPVEATNAGPDGPAEEWAALRSSPPDPIPASLIPGEDGLPSGDAWDSAGSDAAAPGGPDKEVGSTRFPPEGEGFLHFAGQGSSLLWLYVVNFVFMVLTLGVYAFWGKTRIRRYLWSRTLAFGDPLEYTGTGWQLCRSFLIVISLFFGLNLLLTLLSLISLEASLLASMAFTLMLVLFWPYAVYSALRFRLARTNWRGIHGWLSGSPVEYAAQAWVRAMLIVVTLGLFTPYAVAFLTRFIVDNASFGSVKFRFEAEVKTLSRPYYVCWLAGLLMAVCILAAVVLLWEGEHPRGRTPEPTLLAFVGLSALGLLLCRLIYGVVLLNWRIRGVRFGGARLDSRVTVPGYLWLTLSNGLLLVVTLGVAWPWTVVRRYRYLADRIRILGEVRWADVRQSAAAPPKSGEGLLSFLDLDLGF